MLTTSRADLLRRGAALVAAGTGLAALSPAADAAAPDTDLSAVRLLIGVELLALDFQEQALASGNATGSLAPALKRMHADETAHYAGLARLLTGAGQVPATGDDIDFSYPKGTFASQSSILEQAATIEQLTLGAYIGTAANVSTAAFRQAIAQITANEAQHAGALAQLGGKPFIGRAFGPAWSAGAVSDALDVYES
jgi:hypothetical protein